MAHSPPTYPDDLNGAVSLLTTFPGTRYYDDFTATYPSTEPRGSSMAVNLQCSSSCHQLANECEAELTKISSRSQRLQDEISGKELHNDIIEGVSCIDGPYLSMFGIRTARSCVSRCGAWDTLGASHAWQTGFIPLPSRTPIPNKGAKQKCCVITTKWHRISASHNDKAVLAVPIPISAFESSSIVFKSISTTISCAQPRSVGNLMSIVADSCLYDVLTMPPSLGMDCPEEARKVFNLALGSTSRSAFVMLLASDHINITAALFHGLSSFYAGTHFGDCISVFPDELFDYSTPTSLYSPKQANALPPKLSGIARDPSLSFTKAVEHVGPRGCISLPTPFSFTIGYDVGMYGPSIGSVFANMDTSFLYDYSVAVQNPKVQAILQQCFSKVHNTFSGETLVEGYISTIAPIIWANYEALSYKTRAEDKFGGIAGPCAVVWSSLPVLAAYRLVDAAFMHAFYDSDMSNEAIAMAGLGLAIHDLFDLAKDVSEGEVANTVPSLTRGDLSLPSLAALYSRLGAILRWYGSSMPDDPAALCILLTFWWQMGNMRHRIVQAVSVADESERARIPAVTTIDHQPSFDDFAVGDCHEQEVVWQSKQDRVAEPDVDSHSLSPELTALGRDFVLPYGSTATDFCAKPPADHICTARIMATLSKGLNSGERLTLWKWMSYLWDNGSCWASLLGTLCYSKPGSESNQTTTNDHSGT